MPDAVSDQILKSAVEQRRITIEHDRFDFTFYIQFNRIVIWQSIIVIRGDQFSQ